MIFLALIAGTILGMIGAGLFIFAGVLVKQRDVVSNPVAQLISTAEKLGKEKGGIIYAKSEDQINLESIFEANDKKGRDTEFGEIIDV